MTDRDFVDAAQLEEFHHHESRVLVGMTKHEALYIEAHRISGQIADVLVEYAEGDTLLLGLLSEAARPLACLQAELKRRKMVDTSKPE